MENSEYYHPIISRKTAEFQTSKVMREKGYPRDSTYDDLLGITDFSNLSENNPKYESIHYSGRQDTVGSNIALLTHPYTLVTTPFRFEYCGFQDILEQHDIIFPNAESPYSDCSRAPVVHKKFIQVLLEHGFTDFRTYPVRVYYMNQFKDIYSSDPSQKRYRFDTHDRTPRVSSEEAISKFRYSDDLYVMFQLTNAEVPLFDEDFRLELIEKYKGQPFSMSDLKLRSDLSSVEFPLLFRFQFEQGLFCNPQLVAPLERFKFLRLGYGITAHRSAYSKNT